MVSIQTGAAPQAVLQGARHVLYVEGDGDGLDVRVLQELVTPRLRVEPLGPSFSVRSVATALRAFHPEYWFVVDRDDWSDEEVERSWADFPDPQHDNLLIWRRRELENYFFEPEWVCESRFFKTKKKIGNESGVIALERWLAREANSALWLEAANHVLVARRNVVKHGRSELLKPGMLPRRYSREDVIAQLLASPIIKSLKDAVAGELSEDVLRRAFEAEVKLLSADQDPLRWGHGRWRELISGKEIFRTMINQWFSVPDESQPGGPYLRGREAERAVAVDLLKNHQDSMPQDFKQLRRMLDEAVEAGRR